MAPDPKPRRRGYRPRKGVEPKGLRRWRLSQKHKADPRPTRRRRRQWKAAHAGPRGGRYWQGPHKRRYDPQPRRSYRGRFRGGLGRASSKIEGGLARWGMPLGFGLAMLFGVKTGLDKFQAAYGDKGNDYYVKDITGGWVEGDADSVGSLVGKPAEIANLWAPYRGMTTQSYLTYKILGKSQTGEQVPSSWVVPFWASLIAWIAGLVARRSGVHSAARIGRVIEPIGKGAFAASLIGALALPGCPDKQGIDYSAGKVSTGGRSDLRAARPILQHQYIGQNEGAY